MEIDINAKLFKLVSSAISAHMGAEKPRGDEIHASDLGSPMKAYWQRKYPLPPTDYEIGYWLTGRAHHYHLVYSMTGIDDTQEESLWSEELQIKYSPDVNTHDIEFKTTRMFDEPHDSQEALRFFRHYIKQCLTYAVAKSINYFHLVVLFICPVADMKSRKLTSSYHRAYTFKFTDEELADHKKWVISTGAKLRLALKKNDPSKLELCDENFCLTNKGQGRGKPALIEPTCKFWNVCKPKGRYQMWENPPTTIKEKRAMKVQYGLTKGNTNDTEDVI